MSLVPNPYRNTPDDSRLDYLTQVRGTMNSTQIERRPSQQYLSQSVVADSREKPTLSRSEAAKLMGIGLSTLSEKYSPHSKRYDPSFPKPVSLGSGRRAMFWTHEINDWCNDSARRKTYGAPELKSH